MEYGEDRHHEVEKIWHNSDITTNWTSLQKWWKDEKKTDQRGFQEAYSNIKVAAGIFGKYGLYTKCDNNLLYSSYSWAMG